MANSNGDDTRSQFDMYRSHVEARDMAQSLFERVLDLGELDLIGNMSFVYNRLSSMVTDDLQAQVDATAPVG